MEATDFKAVGINVSGKTYFKDCKLDKLNLCDARLTKDLDLDCVDTTEINLSRAIVNGDAFVTGCVVKCYFKAHDTTFSKDLKFAEKNSGDNQKPQQNIFSGQVDLSGS